MRLIACVLAYLRVLCTPMCWLQNNPYSRLWDERLNRMLQEHKFANATWCEATLGGVTLWIANHPYASFTTKFAVLGEVRPSRRTILAAHDKLVRECLIEEFEVEEMERMMTR